MWITGAEALWNGREAAIPTGKHPDNCSRNPMTWCPTMAKLIVAVGLHCAVGARQRVTAEADPRSYGGAVKTPM